MLLKYNNETDKFELEPVFVTYVDTLLGKVKFSTDNASAIEAMCSNDPKRFSNFQIGLNVLSDEQQARLDKANKIKIEEGHSKASFVSEASEYVEHGLIRLKNVRTEFHKLATKEIKESSKQYWVNQLKPKLAALRYEKEVGGVEVDGKMINTSRESQNSITTTLAAVQAGLLKEVLYKTESGFVTLSAAKYTDLAMTVVQHVNKCFKAEADAIAAFEALSLEELEEDNGQMGEEQEVSLTTGRYEERAKFAFDKFYNK